MTDSTPTAPTAKRAPDQALELTLKKTPQRRRRKLAFWRVGWRHKTPFCAVLPEALVRHWALSFPWSLRLLFVIRRAIVRGDVMTLDVRRQGSVQ